MKYLSKLLSMLLVGAMLTVTACTDYDEDIKNLNDKVDNLKQELVEGQINPLKADLEATAAALEDAIEAAEAKIAENKAEIADLKAVDAEHTEAIEAANKAIADAVTNFEAALAELETNHDADIEAVNAKIEEEAKKATEAIEAAVALITENQEAIDALEAKDAELAKSIDEALVAIQANATKIGENATAIAENKTNIATNATAIETLQADLLDLAGQFTAYKAELEAAIATLESRMDTAEAAIETLKEDVAELYTMHDNQALLIDNLQSQINALDIFVSEQLALLEEADKALNDLIVNLENSFIDYKKIVNEQFTKAFGQIAENAAAINALAAKHEEEVKSLVAQDAAILETLEMYRTWLVELEADVEELYTMHDNQAALIGDLQNQINALDSYVTEQIDILNKDIEALGQKIVDLKSDLENQINRVDEHVAKALADAKAYAEEKANNAQLAAQAYTDVVLAEFEKSILAITTDLQNKIDQLNAYAVSIEEALNAYKETNDKALEQLRGDLEAMIGDLVNRIQSIVYVPEYTDGKITIDYAKFGGNIVEGRSTIEYQVYPAEGAYAIEQAFNNAETYPEFNIWFDMQGLKTRANAPELTVVDVKSSANGRLELTVLARGFSKEFYAQDVNENYAVSLAVDMGTNTETGSANLSTCYTQLIAAKSFKDIEMRIMGPESAAADAEFVDVTGNKSVYTYELEYANIDANPDFVSLPGYYLLFNFVGEETKYTKAEFAAYGYEVNPEMKRTIEVTPGSVVVWAGVLNETTGYYEEQVDIQKADANAVGKTFNKVYTYAYPNSDRTIFAGSTLAIVAEQRNVKIGEFTETWKYSLDARGDAGMSIYSRTITTTEKVFDGKELPEGKTLADIINGDSEPVITITNKEGEVVTDVIAKIGAKGEEVVINFANFGWDESYNVTAVYGVPNNEGIDALEVNVKFVVNTVNRSQDAIVINLDPTDYDFASNLILTNEISNSIDMIYDNLKLHHSDIDVEKSVWFNENMIADTYTSTCDLFVDGAETAVAVDYNNADWGTMLLIDEVDAAGQAVYTTYNYNDFDFIPEQITYTKTVTTWYGQQIVINKVLNFVFPTMEGVDFKHANNYVKNVDGVYQSKVHPAYSPSADSAEITSFSTKEVNMNAAFNLTVDGKLVLLGLEDGKASTDTYDFVAEFHLENGVDKDGKPVLVDEYEGVTIKNNSVSYNAKPESVNVFGELYVTNDNGAKRRLTTSFDEDGIYSTYIVVKYDPITEPDDVSKLIPVTSAKEYVYNMFELIDLRDYRDGYTTYSLIDPKTGSFVIGDGTNGFADGTIVKNIYSLDHYWSATFTSEDPELPVEEIKKYVDVDPATGILTFDNTHELNLVKPIKVKATLLITTPWSDHDVNVYVEFYQASGKVEETPAE